MDEYTQQLKWISQQRDPMIQLLINWVNINSGTDNLEGLKKMLQIIQESLQIFEEPIEEISLEPGLTIDDEGTLQKRYFGKALRMVKRPEAPIQILFCGHMDTVYPQHSPFQRTKRINDQTLIGPGATDMKGGLIIMLKALEALEQYEHRHSIGWEILINPDEEIGSVGSEPLICKSAIGKNIGLIFEPSFPDGYLVCSRKGSINFTILSKGLSAHAGRDFDKGRNAITQLIKLLIKVEALNGNREGLTINLGRIQGGGPTNIVPDLAICRCNSRMSEEEDADFLLNELERLIGLENEKEGTDLQLHRDAYRPPKTFDRAHQNLFEDMRLCSGELSGELHWRLSGGVCDGNILAREGLATIDTLGAIGSGIHTYDETIQLDSLVDRAQLCALFLMKIASHVIDVSRYKRETPIIREP
jgi:glutamate carboxypeptidase